MAEEIRKTYTLGESSITCLRCGMTSHNPNDVRYRYCGNCNEFHAGARCDFCMAPEVELVETYKAKAKIIAHGNIPRPNVDLVDDGEWMACADCNALILAKNWNAIIDRALVGTFAMDPSVRYSPDIAAGLKTVLLEVFGVILGD